LRIVIAGGSGFLGSPLAEGYAREGHDVRVLTRALPTGESRHDPGTGVPGVTRLGWNPDGQSGPWAAALDGADAVVNLAGEGLSDKRWTPQRKAELRDSRIVPTRSLVAAIGAVAAASGFALWLAAAVALGLGTAMVYPTLLAAVADVAAPAWRGSAVGVYRWWRDLGFAAGAIVAGVVADRLGMTAAIWTVAALTALSGLFAALRMRETRPRR